MKSHASMNRIYRLVFNAATGMWVAVAENARGKGKGGRAASALLAVLAILSPTAYAANAADASVVGGAGTVATSGLTTTINQTSQRLAIDWTKLSTVAGEALSFVQPNAQAIALNRITGSTPSSFLGSLTANGQVFILNPNGVLFGAGSQVNVGGLVASTLAMSNADFMNGSTTFSKTTGTGSVVNQGTMTAVGSGSGGGYLALLAPEVRNEGVMTSTLGTALLAAGNKVTLNLDNGSLLGYSIDQGAINALAENKQLIKADGGQVLLSAKALDALTTATVNNTGVIEARTIQNIAGRIMLMGDMEHGTVNVGGTLDASAPQTGNGGFIETSAANVKVADTARVTTLAASGKTGTWLIDPTDFSIDAGGGGRTTSGIGADTLVSSLNNSHVIIETAAVGADAGDIFVNAAVNWSTNANFNNNLTLTAHRNIDLSNGSLAGGSGSTVTLNAGNGGTVGAIIGHATDTVVRAGTLIANAKTGIGSSGTPLRTQVVNAALTNSTSGGIYLTNLGDLTVAANSALGDIVIRTLDGAAGSPGNNGRNAGNITIDTVAGVTGLTTTYTGFSGAISVVSGTGGSGGNGVSNRVGRSGGAGGAIIVNAAITSADAVTLTAGNGGNGGNGGTGASGGSGGSGAVVSLNASVASGGVVTLAAGRGGIGGTGNGSGSNGSSGSAAKIVGTDIDVAAGSNLTFNSGIAASSGNISLKAGMNAGNTLTLSGLTLADPSVDSLLLEGNTLVGLPTVLAANSMSIKTANGIGNSTNALQTSVNNLALENTGNGGIYVTNSKDLAVAAKNANGDIVIKTAAGADGANNTTGSAGVDGGAGGNITVASLYLLDGITTQNSGDVVLMAGGGGKGGVDNDGGSSRDGNGGAGGTVALNGAVSSRGVLSISAGAGGAGGFGSRSEGGTGGAGGGVTTNRFADLSGSNALTLTAGAGGNGGYGRANGDGGDGGGVELQASVVSNGDITIRAGTGGAPGARFGARAGYAGGVNIGYVNAFVGAGGNLSVYGDISSSFGDIDFGAGANTGNAITLRDVTGTLSSQITASDNVTFKADKINTGPDGLFITASAGAVNLTQTGTANTMVLGAISAASLTVDSAGMFGYMATNATKVCDGGTAAAVTTAGVFGVAVSQYSNLRLALPTTANYDTKRVGTGINVTASGFSLTGYNNTDSSVLLNAGAALTASTTADITKADITVTGLSAANKVYSTTTAATLSGTARVAALGSDVLTVGGTATGSFATKDAANGKAVTVVGNTLGGADADNYNLIQQIGLTANITKADVTVSGLLASNKVYDVGTAASITGTAAIAALGTDVLTVGGAAVGSFATKAVGTSKAVTVTGNMLSGADAGNYNLIQQTGLTANISKADITVSGLSASNKVYDAGTVASITGTAAVAALGTDVLTLGGTATGNFATKAAANGKAVTVTGNTLGGADAGNYNLIQQTGLTANIAKADITVSGLTAANKVYDAGTVAALTGTAAVTRLGSDVLTVGGTATGSFATKAAANGKAVMVVGNTLGGADAGNYNLIQQSGLTANIAKADVIVYGMLASNKTYDAGTVAALTGTATVVALSGDILTISGTATGSFATKAVGASKAVIITGNTLGGADAGNYNLIQQTGLTANITKADITVSGLSASNKVYDAGTVAALTGTAAVTRLGSDVLTVGGVATGSFVTKVAANSKAVTVTGNTLGGADAGNYNLLQQTGLTANITKADITVSGLSASNKVYDAGTVAALTGTAAVTRLGSDVLTVGGAAVGGFATKLTGIGKAVTVTGNTLGGADAGNYNLLQQTGLTANITKADVTVSGLAASNKVYDAGTVAVLTGTTRVTALGTDALTVGGTTTGSFATKDAANGKAVTVVGNTLGGADAGNYNLIQQTGLTANITHADITVSGLTAANKTYDAGAVAALSGTAVANGVLAADRVTVINGAASFADKAVGTGKGVTVTGSVLGGADAGNYRVTEQTGLAANITPADIHVAGLRALNKVYDTTSAALLQGTAAVAALGSDVLTVGGTASGSFANKLAANGKAVTVTGNTLGGADAGNYNLIQQTGLTANIAKADVTVTGLSAANKTYDAGTVAALTGTASVAGLGTDALTVGGAAIGSFATKAAANGKAVTVTGNTLGGADAGNYNLVQQTGLTANITQADVTVSGLAANNKVYDSGTAATLSGNAVVTGLLAADSVTVTPGAARFADKTVGTGKAVTVTGSALGGADAGNYRVLEQTGLTANVTKLDVIVDVSGARAIDKVYDGGTAASFTGFTRTSSMYSADQVDLSRVALRFTDKDAGTFKVVSVASDYLTGADAGNYNVVQRGSLTGTITKTPLLVNANNDTRNLNGQPYAGGNGVRFNGFVAGETAAVLGGALRYSGSSQGASTPGSFAIAPGGLTAANYAVQYANGTLTLAATDNISAALGGPALVASYNAALQSMRPDAPPQRPASFAQSQVRSENCGVRMPAGFDTSECN